MHATNLIHDFFSLHIVVGTGNGIKKKEIGCGCNFEEIIMQGLFTTKV